MNCFLQKSWQKHSFFRVSCLKPTSLQEEPGALQPCYLCGGGTTHLYALGVSRSNRLLQICFSQACTVLCCKNSNYLHFKTLVKVLRAYLNTNHKAHASITSAVKRHKEKLVAVMPISQYITITDFVPNHSHRSECA